MRASLLVAAAAYVLAAMSVLIWPGREASSFQSEQLLSGQRGGSGILPTGNRRRTITPTKNF